MDMTKLALVMLGNIREFVQPALDAVGVRVEELENRLDSIPEPQPLPDIVRMVKEAVAAIPAPQDGRSITAQDVAPMLDGMVREAVSALPKPADGKDADPEVIRHLVVELVSALPPPRDGKDADPEAIKAAILAELPAPEPGKSVTPDDVRLLIAEEVGKAVDAIPRPADGSSITLEDVRPLLEAEISKWALNFERRAQGVLERATERMPKAKDGADGLDGLGFDDLSIEHDGERVFTFKMQRGDRRKEFAFVIPAVIDRGVFKEGSQYAKGDAVTWAGSLWIAQGETSAKPDGGDCWRLGVKRGRDGKDGRDLSPRVPQPVKL